MRIDVEVPTTLSVLDFYAQIGAFVSFELIHIVIILLGGIALFLFGMQLMGDGLKKVAGGKLEVILYRLSNTPLKGVLLGTGVTAIIQSSSATSVMVVGFVNAGMIKMKQAIGIIMGAIIGTSVTGWVLCLSDISGGAGWVDLLSTEVLAAVIGVIGIMFRMICKNPTKKHIGDIMIGFCILMVGMQNMSAAVAPLRSEPAFIDMLTKFSNPFIGILIGQILQYQDALQSRGCGSFSELLDEFYLRRDKAEAMRRRSQELTHQVRTLRDRTAKKLAIQH